MNHKVGCECFWCRPRPSPVRTLWYDRSNRLAQFGGYFKILLHQGGMELHLKLHKRHVITHWLPDPNYGWPQGEDRIDVDRELPPLFSEILLTLGIPELECYGDEEERDFVHKHRLGEAPAEVR